MTTNISTTSAAAGALASLGNLKAGLAKVQTAIPAAGGEPILRMGRDGVWLYGAENTEVEDGSRWAVNPLSLQHGYICWKKVPEGSREKPEKLGEVLVSMYEDKPLKSSLQTFEGSPWAEQTAVTLRCISGEDEGEQTEYKPSSVGGQTAMKDLISAIMQQLDRDPAKPVPVVVLKSTSYQHKTYGKTYTPVLEIVDWIGMDGAAPAAAEGSDDPTPEELAEDSQQASQDAAPAGETRRRRRSA